MIERCLPFDLKIDSRINNHVIFGVLDGERMLAFTESWGLAREGCIQMLKLDPSSWWIFCVGGQPLGALKITDGVCNFISFKKHGGFVNSVKPMRTNQSVVVNIESTGMSTTLV